MTIIIKDIILEPKYLNKDLKKNIIKKIVEQINNECSQTYGYILSFNKIIRIISNQITPANSDLIFKVEFDANTLLPKKGDILRGEIFMIFDKGIFLTVEKKLKILIPSDNLNKFVYKILDNNESIYINQNDSKVLKIKDFINFEITCIKYSDSSFSCIGKLH